MKPEIKAFIAADCDFETADTVIFGAPYHREQFYV